MSALQLDLVGHDLLYPVFDQQILIGTNAYLHISQEMVIPIYSSPLSPSPPVSPLSLLQNTAIFLNEVRIFTLFPFSSSTSYPYHFNTQDFQRELQ